MLLAIIFYWKNMALFAHCMCFQRVEFFCYIEGKIWANWLRKHSRVLRFVPEWLSPFALATCSSFFLHLSIFLFQFLLPFSHSSHVIPTTATLRTNSFLSHLFYLLADAHLSFDPLGAIIYFGKKYISLTRAHIFVFHRNMHRYFFTAAFQ